MKKIILFFILFFSFVSQTFAFDLFGEISDTKISENNTFTFQVEVLNNQNFDEKFLTIDGIENFLILSQNLSVQSMSFNGVSSYKKQFSFTLQPKSDGKFSLQPIYKDQTEEKIGEKFEIIVEKGLKSQENIIEEKNVKKYDFGFEIWFLLIGVIIFLFFTKVVTSKNKNTENEISKNIGFFDDFFWSENIDYIDLKIILVQYLQKFHGFGGKSGSNYSEISDFLEKKNLDTNEKNTIQSIILSLQSSEFSSLKVDKKDLFYKILELKNFNNSI